MPELTADGDVVEAFLDALQEASNAAEFERLTSGDETRRPYEESMRGIEDGNDALTIRLVASDPDEPSALDRLRSQRALERLQVRHPDVWEQVTLTLVEGGS